MENTGEISKLEFDNNFIKLREKYEKTNFFEIIGNSWNELWHSSFLSWLLNPKGSHGLGDLALTGFMKLYYDKFGKEELDTNIIDKLNLESMNFTAELSLNKIFAEESLNAYCDDGKRRIDIYGRNKTSIIVIENKIKTTEQGDQTVAYYNAFNAPIFEDKQKYFVYLCVDSQDEAKDEHFVKVTYQELYEYVLSKCVMDDRLSSENRIIIENYIDILGRPFEGDKVKYSNQYRSPMAFVDIDTCKKIFDANKSAFDCIRDLVKNNEMNNFVEQYGNLINIILESIGESKIKNSEKTDCMTQLLELCKKEIIRPNDESSEFVAHLYTKDENNGAYFIVQLMEETNKYYFISGYEAEKDYNRKDEVASLKDENGDMKMFNSITQALDAAIYDYKTKILKKTDFTFGSNSGPGDVLKNRDGMKISELYDCYCKTDND